MRRSFKGIRQGQALFLCSFAVVGPFYSSARRWPQPILGTYFYVFALWWRKWWRKWWRHRTSGRIQVASSRAEPARSSLPARRLVLTTTWLKYACDSPSNHPELRPPKTRRAGDFLKPRPFAGSGRPSRHLPRTFCVLRSFLCFIRQKHHPAGHRSIAAHVRRRVFWPRRALPQRRGV